ACRADLALRGQRHYEYHKGLGCSLTIPQYVWT
ncbi:MAG: hypothetical protein ACI9HX_001560, partial [Pseudoalteromonas tetraodonis]